jgi:general secretion pathway protein A
MYERFYGLTRTPFAVTPDPAMLFMSQVHREALATIIYGVETRKGFIVCTGEVGTGKSTIIRAFFDQTLADTVKLIYIFTPQVSPLEMAQYICSEMGMEQPDSVFAAVPQLQMKLLEVFEAGRTVVLMIDEAQLLPPETLEFLRLLSNFETDTEKLIQIVLVGQPEVDTMLARRDMRQVNQRVALRARLAGLSAEESFAYIEHRLSVCGAGELGQVMSPSAAWLIVEAAGGIPRVINILADNALIAGFGAAQRPLGSRLAGSTVRDFAAKSGPARPPTQRLGNGWRAARRLRGALIRERGESEGSLSSAPAASGRAASTLAPPAPKNLAPMPRSAPLPPPASAFEWHSKPDPATMRAAPQPVPPPQPVPTPEPSATFVAAPPPAAEPLEPLWRADPVTTLPPAAPAPQQVDEPPPASPAEVPPTEVSAAEIRPGAVDDRLPGTAAILVEPTIDWEASDIAAGLPVSTADLVMVVPEAQGQVATVDFEPPTVPQRRVDLPGAASHQIRPALPRMPPRVNGSVAPLAYSGNESPLPHLTARRVHWPALNRVRLGLQPAQRPPGEG